jgi:hypothetical protein
VRFLSRSPGTREEMQSTITEDRNEGGHAHPLENPAVDPIPGDPLTEPHPAEPGVEGDGSASPLENPDDTKSADPLVGYA